jgi:hypothetical protein
MAFNVNTNTTQSIQKASVALGEKCEETKKNIKTLAKKLYGEAEAKMERVVLPKIPGEKDDVLSVWVNGIRFDFMRGQTVEMPAACAEVLRNAGKI